MSTHELYQQYLRTGSIRALSRNVGRSAEAIRLAFVRAGLPRLSNNKWRAGQLAALHRENTLVFLRRCQSCKQLSRRPLVDPCPRCGAPDDGYGE